MSKTKIEWLRSTDGRPGYTINPVKGLCPMACDYCYARRMYKRFKWNPEVRYEDPFYDFYALKNKPPCRVFIGSTIELFGDWIRPEWIHNILGFCHAYPQHTFIFLTKKPENLQKWSPFPGNCWVGVSATNEREVVMRAGNYMPSIEAKVKFLSIEPLLSWDTSRFVYPLAHSLKDINFVIIGQQTPARTATAPKIEWIREIIEAADKAQAPVFLKDNLLELVNYESTETEFAFNKEGFYRQESPK